MKGTSTVSDLVTLLKSHRFNYSSEKDLQAGIETLLNERGYLYEREASLGDAGVIDFLLIGAFGVERGGIGIEVKIKGSPAEVARQLLRYAERNEINEIILVTGRARLGKLPETLHGKPITVVPMWESFL